MGRCADGRPQREDGRPATGLIYSKRGVFRSQKEQAAACSQSRKFGERWAGPRLWGQQASLGGPEQTANPNGERRCEDTNAKGLGRMIEKGADTHLLLASETRMRGRPKSSLRRWLCSVSLRSLSSDMDCFAREDIVEEGGARGVGRRREKRFVRGRYSRVGRERAWVGDRGEDEGDGCTALHCQGSRSAVSWAVVGSTCDDGRGLTEAEEEGDAGRTEGKEWAGTGWWARREDAESGLNTDGRGPRRARCAAAAHDRKASGISPNSGLTVPLMQCLSHSARHRTLIAHCIVLE
jgi:hypothetical protein